MGLPQSQRAPGYAGKLTKKPKPSPSKDRVAYVNHAELKDGPQPEKGEYKSNSAAKSPADLAPSGPVDYGLAPNATDEAYRMNPAMLGESARSKAQADPAAIAAQQRAMNELFGIYSQGGATAQDRARAASARLSNRTSASAVWADLEQTSACCSVIGKTQLRLCLRPTRKRRRCMSNALWTP
jgi:hypothetical protein